MSTFDRYVLSKLAKDVRYFIDKRDKSLEWSINRVLSDMPECKKFESMLYDLFS